MRIDKNKILNWASFAFCLFLLCACSEQEIAVSDEGTTDEDPAVEDGLLLFPRLGDFPLSSTFTLKVNGQVASVETKGYYDVPIHYAQLSSRSGETLQIEVTVAESINKYSISPLRKNIQGSTKGNTLQFTVSEPGYLLVRINDLEDLFILINPMVDYRAQIEGKKIIDVADYVSDITGQTVQTSALQQAIDEAARQQAVLYFPNGIYRTGTLHMRSNMTVFLSDGALIIGSTVESDYIREKEYGTNAAACGSLIRLAGVSNFRMIGNGTIDGAAWSGLRRKPGESVPEGGKPVNYATEIYLMFASDCRNLYFDGVVLRDPVFWNTRIFRSQEVRMENIKVLNDRPERDWTNTDGIVFDSSSHCSLRNAVIYGGDDNCVVKGRDRRLEYNTENILYDGVLTVTNSSGVKIGTETFVHRISEVVFRNIDIVSAQRSIVIDAKDGSQISNVRFEHIVVEGFYKLSGGYRLIDFRLMNRDAVPCTSTISDIKISDVDVWNGMDGVKVRFEEKDEKSFIRNVILKDMKVRHQKVGSLQELVEKVNNLELNNYVYQLLLE
ncbi:glycosyl hydrolase family 28 protein [uncultured Bacteroides sp.]|jgi:hypothetical protein|uniref:glycoside hydrolase family 28 protein n=1 Tax=uncultured Bacteroides sp. TaxID=162156 RepID=UPI00258F364A|nr:glycosyl hydrolase family 28 protein [uncultured Bacteroides sp.]